MKTKKKIPLATSELTATQRKHFAAYLALERANDKLSRALTAWQKARKQLRRLDKRLDKETAGTADWRELAQSADKIKLPEKNR